jgi:pimeloyl-ACP methyl ester carboxylesterase
MVLNASLMKRIGLSILLTVPVFLLQAQVLPGFKISGAFNEQQMVIENSPPGTRILINAPVEGFGRNDRVLLVIYALPNGNTIEQTFGKIMKEGDDWHFDIQHIGAQTRFIRGVLKDQTVVVAYLENSRKSWPAWNANTPDYREQVTRMVSDITGIFAAWNPKIVLNGHSGGGRFIFSYLDAFENIPDNVVRISFLDSDYGWEDTVYGPKLIKWLKSGNDKYLCALAYNDSVVVYNGKQLVSPTGGTWYRTRMMEKYLSGSFRFRKTDNDTLIWYRSLRRRVEVILKTNPDGKIFHTVQVERNGFIHSMLSGTKMEEKGYAYFGQRAYSDFIADRVDLPLRRLNIPERDKEAESGSAFMRRIDTLPLNEREEEIFKALASGNIPGFLRNLITVKDSVSDAHGVVHIVEYQVMPDYLAVGSNTDFCRIPMSPHTAQRLADLFGASLVTAQVSDAIYRAAEIRLTPFNYIPVGNANELVTKFEAHNAQIEKQLEEAGGHHGQLVAGIKKDVILSSRLATQSTKVVIYGWHKPDGKPIQPVYSGHVDWYVDYSHGIRFINNQVLIDGTPFLFTDILKDPVLYKLFSDEDSPMQQPFYKNP